MEIVMIMINWWQDWSGRPILSIIIHMITERVRLHKVLLPLLITFFAKQIFNIFKYKISRD